jgi:hypothetical protein
MPPAPPAEVPPLLASAFPDPPVPDPPSQTPPPPLPLPPHAQVSTGTSATSQTFGTRMVPSLAPFEWSARAWLSNARRRRADAPQIRLKFEG